MRLTGRFALPVSSSLSNPTERAVFFPESLSPGGSPVRSKIHNQLNIANPNRGVSERTTGRNLESLVGIGVRTVGIVDSR
jgi:hypothetical protein